MSQWDKLLKKVRNLSRDVRFDELKKVLEHYGYTMQAPHSGSSHFTFRKEGRERITIPKHDVINKVYIMMVRDVVEKEENDEE